MIWALAAPTYDPDNVKPGWVALGLVVLLAVATFLLWRSMNTRLKRINVPTNAEVRQTQLDAQAVGRRDDAAVEPADPDPDAPPESRNGVDPGPRP